MSTTVIGVDGWKDGWVAAVATGRRVTWKTFVQPGRSSKRDAFARLLDSYGDAAIAVDIPIGTVAGTRRADAEAATWLRAHGAQRSSIFMTPSTDLIDAHRRRLSHRQAMDNARARGTPLTSIQAWNLIPKIVEVEAALSTHPGAGTRVVEAHPECSLRQLELTLRETGYDEPPLGRHSKKSAVGIELRLRLLRQVFRLPDLARAPDGVPMDDLLDACAVAWTAQRMQGDNRDPITIPSDPEAGEPRIVIDARASFPPGGSEVRWAPGDSQFSPT